MGGFLYLAAVSLPCGAQTPQPKEVVQSTNRTPVWSSSRLFHVAGGGSVDNLQTATFADKIRKAVAKRMSKSVPVFALNPILITLVDQRDAPPRVERRQRYALRTLEQEIRVLGPATVDQEQLLEAITWCLVNRHAVYLQSEAERTRAPVECPEWLSTGLAQNLFPETRTRNRSMLQRLMGHSDLMSIDELMAWNKLPTQRPVPRAECELLVSWLRSNSDTILYDICLHLSKGNDVGREWVADQFGVFGRRDVLKAYDVWRAHEVMPTPCPAALWCRRYTQPTVIT